MKFCRQEIPDVVLIEPTLHGDSRGYFSETFRQDLFEEFIGRSVVFCQDNESKSGFGVLRGLHFQLPPYAQSKLVRVIEGKVLDVVVDIREGSPYFGKHVSVMLDSDFKKQLFVPRGFAHGFVVLSETATFAYKVDNYYAPDFDRGLIYNDSALQVDWILKQDQFRLSDKDRSQPTLSSLQTESSLFSNDVNLYE